VAASGITSEWSDFLNHSTLPAPQPPPQVSQGISPNNTHIKILWQDGRPQGIITNHEITLYNDKLDVVGTFSCVTCTSAEIKCVFCPFRCSSPLASSDGDGWWLWLVAVVVGGGCGGGCGGGGGDRVDACCR
jgi:hypothetical protein